MFRCDDKIAIADMVIANNAIKLWEIRDRVLADNVTSGNVNAVSTITIARVNERHQMQMKQLYAVPFKK